MYDRNISTTSATHSNKSTFLITQNIFPTRTFQSHVIDFVKFCNISPISILGSPLPKRGRANFSALRQKLRDDRKSPLKYGLNFCELHFGEPLEPIAVDVINQTKFLEPP